ncbi:MAG: restriction endonuclease subunit S, partial [Propionicimonas sp.]
REIVRILDTFTALEAELEAELEARSRQFNHYRDRLLTSTMPRHSWMKMGDVGDFVRGRRFTKSDVVDSGIPSIHYGEIYTHYGVSGSVALSQVSNHLFSQLRFASTGDVVVAAVGETVEDVGKAVAWLGDDPVAIHDDTFMFHGHGMNPVFVSYFLQTAAFHQQKNKHVARAKVKRLSGGALATIQMPIPPLEEQAGVVAALRSFDALVNDLAVGLPAELVARRRQYEYYRDRLLSFEELQK